MRRAFCLFLTFISLGGTCWSSNPRISFEKYVEARWDLLTSEDRIYLGHDLTLTQDEKDFDKILMKYKDHEINEGFLAPGNFTGARHFFHVLDRINSSKVFQLIRKMPKGGVLHAHDTALLSTDCLMKFLEWENLFMCDKNDGSAINFWFAKAADAIKKPCEGSAWQKFDKSNIRRLREAFTLYTQSPDTKYTDIQVVWREFLNKFFAIEGLVGYVEVWKEYFMRTLIEFQEDGVQYLEFRGLLPPVYDLDGNFLSKIEIAEAYNKVLQEFLKANPSFIGAKFIYAPLRLVPAAEIANYRETFVKLKQKLPNFIAGFDLVGPEDTNFPLKTFVEELSKFPADTNFFFHAGETNWNGIDVDENLVDAILLGTKRIGHGYAIVKHPKLLAEVKKRGIAIEICPISNQVLKLVADHRNHPAAILFSDDYPVVVSSDDPSLWQATPLSHDFYVAFMGIASANANLRFLKKLALNSLRFSAMNDKEMKVALEKWAEKWHSFVREAIKEHKSQ
ncbi:adenosine deaminase 2-like [Culicoides brevitarsis]|uniref:adenosine deaminase 2-like n=1 Tax=Culicoides brevitarsis TaxID=469753 RepID=UPI00307B3152